MSDQTIVLPRLLDERAGQLPDKTFLAEIGGASKTYAQVARAAQRWSGALARLGVERGEFVGSMLPNGSLGIELWFGINGLGAIEVPIHAEYRGRILAHVLNTGRTRVAVVAARFLPRLAEVGGEIEGLQTVVVPDAVGPLPAASFEVISGSDLLSAATPLAPINDARPKDTCTVLFTSGTTGASKGVMVPYAHLHASTDGAWPLTDLDADDVNYLMLPGYHVSGKVAVSSMLHVGGALAIRERFKTDEFWSDVRDTKATCACIMGAMAGFLMAEPRRTDDASNPLDKVLMLPLPSYLDAFRERFDVRVHTIYNQTEISCPIVSDGFTTGHYTSCGRVRAGYECRVVNDEDEMVAPGEVGELVIRADRPWVMMSGYLGMPEKTVDAWRNQWLHTGDAFRVDHEGNYYFVDRFKDVIRRRGENISSVEVEEAVSEHAEVVECAAVPVPSEWSEEEIKVLVVRTLGSALSAEDLVAFVEPRLPRFMIPRYVEFVTDLPKTPTQKVRKAELRASGVTESTWDREANVSVVRTQSILEPLEKGRTP